jgi:hypothetical protein
MDNSALLTRIAALETENARLRQHDPDAIRREFTANPHGAMQKYGIPQDHVTRMLVATALGDQAPPELKALAMMGPQVTATQALQSENQALRQRLEALEANFAGKSSVESFGKVAVDKAKYPLLAAALAKSPELFHSEVTSHRGDAATLAEQLEGRLKMTAQALGITPTASTADADKANANAQQATSTQAPAPLAGTMGGDPPPIPQKTSGGSLDEQGLRALRDDIVRKAESGAYAVARS